MVVLPRPVDQRQVVWSSRTDKILSREQSSPAKKWPRRLVIRNRRIFAEHRVLHVALPPELSRIVQQQTESLVLRMLLVLDRFGDAMRLTWPMLNRECVSKALYARRISRRTGIRLARALLRLRS